MKTQLSILGLSVALGLSFAFTGTVSAKGLKAKKDPVKEFIKAHDKNHNGTVDKSEFPGSAEEFDKFDKNKDGKLEVYEVKAYLAQHHGKPKSPTSGAPTAATKTN